eukprot:6187218-Pleurochrysis_carterae.AAC.3
MDTRGATAHGGAVTREMRVDWSMASAASRTVGKFRGEDSPEEVVAPDSGRTESAHELAKKNVYKERGAERRAV